MLVLIKNLIAIGTKTKIPFNKYTIYYVVNNLTSFVFKILNKW